MKKSLIIAYICAGALILFGFIGSALLLKPNKINTVQILRDSEILYTIDLGRSENCSIRIDYGESYNLVEIENGQIRVKEAGCKDNTCVKMGWLSSSAAIVCLPNHLVIKFADTQEEIDAVAGLVLVH